MEEDKTVSLDDLESRDPYKRLLAARALGEGAPIVPRPTPDERVVLSGVSKSGQISLSELLVPLLRDEDQLVRAEATWALGERGEESAVKILAEALIKDPDEYVRTSAARALAKLRKWNGRTIDALKQALKDTSVDVRLEVVRALGQLAKQPVRQTLGTTREENEATKTLRQVTESDNSVLRRAAQAQLRILAHTREE